MDGDASYSKFVVLIEEYEHIINALTEQVDTYKEDHEYLKKELTNVVADNNDLRSKLQTVSQQHLEDARPESIEQEELNNLKQRLQLAIQEKDCLTDLWSSSLQTIDRLEDQLRLYEGTPHGYHTKEEFQQLKQTYETQITQLQQELISSQKSLQQIVQSCKCTIQSKAQHLQEALNDQKHLHDDLKRMQKELSELQENQRTHLQLKEKLEGFLKEKCSVIEDLDRKLQEANGKVREAVQLVEGAFLEKDEALRREFIAKEDVAKMSRMLSEMVEETKEKVKNETEIIKAKFSVQVQRLQSELQYKDEDLKIRTLDYEQSKKEVKMLEEQVERLRKGNICLDDSNTSKLLILEKSLESTFHKLMFSEKKLMQIVAEKESVQNDMEQMAKHYENDVKTREVEKRVLENKVRTLQESLEQASFEQGQFASRIQELNLLMMKKETDLKNQFQEKSRMEREAYNLRMQEILHEHAAAQSELMEKLRRQVDLNKQWKMEFKDVTDKLDVRLKQIKAESVNLKHVNKELARKLSEAEITSMEYKKSLEKLCQDVNKMAASEDLVH